MTTVTIQLMETDYQRLEKAAERAGKSVQALIYEWIAQLPEIEEFFDITQDPVFQMEGYESDAPADLSVEIDTYLFGHFAVVDFGERIRNTRTVRIIHITEDIEEEAWQLFKQYADKDFSFTDCTSFTVMGHLNLTEAFTNDHHFEQMGLTILLK